MLGPMAAEKSDSADFTDGAYDIVRCAHIVLKAAGASWNSCVSDGWCHEEHSGSG